jgi:phosphoenolpyruvate-protein kinase (PTS system EI component)
MNWKVLGNGTSCFSGEDKEGTLYVVSNLQDVIKIMKNPPEDAIVLTNIAGGTTISPILKKVQGVICTIGSMASHIAIVSREFSLPCIVGAKDIPFDSSLNGKRVRIEKSGSVFVSE